MREIGFLCGELLSLMNDIFKDGVFLSDFALRSPVHNSTLSSLLLCGRADRNGGNTTIP